MQRQPEESCEPRASGDSEEPMHRTEVWYIPVGPEVVLHTTLASIAAFFASEDF